MQVWLKSVAVAVAACLSSGCITLSDDYAYMKSSETNAIDVPSDLKRPVSDTEFRLPKNQIKGDLGTQLDIQAPSQVMPLADGSRIDEEEKAAKIWFDKTIVVDDLEAFIWDSLIDYLETEAINVVAMNEKDKVVETDWIAKEQESGYWFWKDYRDIQKARFKYKVTMRPHGRVGNVEVTLEGFEKLTDERLGTEELVAKHRAEVEALNAFIAHFDFRQRKLAKKLQINTPDTQITELGLGFDNEGWAAFTSRRKIEQVWSQTRTLLEALNFEITDFNNSERVYYVKYEQPDSGIWDSLWGEEKDIPELPLIPGEYVVKVGKNGDDITISFFTARDKSIGAEMMTQLHSTFNETAAKAGLEL